MLDALQVAQFKIDTLMVFWLLSSEATAGYETAYRLLEVCRLAIRPLATIGFPVCALLRQQWAAARDYGMKIILLAAAIGVGVLLIGVLNPERIMVMIWGPAYAGMGGGLRILFVSAPFVFVDMIGVMIATAMGEERQLMRWMALATLFNVATNAIAIPRLGTEGAAWTTLATEILIAACLAFTIRRAARKALLLSVTTEPC